MVGSQASCSGRGCYFFLLWCLLGIFLVGRDISFFDSLIWNYPWIALLYLAAMFFGVFVTLSAIKPWIGKVSLLAFVPLGGTTGIFLCATLTHILPKRWTSYSASHDNHPDDDTGRSLRGLEETPAGDGRV